MIFRHFSDIFAREYRSKKQAGGGYGQGRGVVVCVALQVLLDYITLPCIAARFRHWRIQLPTHLYDLEMIASFRTDSRCAMPQLGEDEEAEDAPAKTACAVYLRSVHEGVRGAISSGEFRTSDAWQEEIEAMRTFATACQDFVAKMTAEAERARTRNASDEPARAAKTHGHSDVVKPRSNWQITGPLLWPVHKILVAAPPYEELFTQVKAVYYGAAAKLLNVSGNGLNPLRCVHCGSGDEMMPDKGERWEDTGQKLRPQCHACGDKERVPHGRKVRAQAIQRMIPDPF